LIEQATRAAYPEGIAAHGTDALRFTFAALASANRDIRFDLQRVAGYRNFCNKLWNAARFVTLVVPDTSAAAGAPGELSIADRWIRSRFGRRLEEVQGALANYRFDYVAAALYEFTWDEFCSWYVELTKPMLQSAECQRGREARHAADAGADARGAATRVAPALCRSSPRRSGSAPRRSPAAAARPSCSSPIRAAADFPHDPEAESEVAWLQKFILAVRQIRGEMDINPSKRIPVLVKEPSERDRRSHRAPRAYLERLAGIETITILERGASRRRQPRRSSESSRILVPMANLIDAAAESERLDKRLAKTHRDLEKTRAQLGNEDFVGNAPAAVVAALRERAAELERTAHGLQAQLQRIRALRRRVMDSERTALQRSVAALETVILGKNEQVRLCLACLLARGHLLIEDVPGVGKTTLAHALAHVLGLAWQRVQFTSDLLPADVIGVSVFDRTRQAFEFRKGPIFTQLLLADEINRASPRTQSALLEAMEERQVSADLTTYSLPDPFFVVATQNPHEEVGTFALPESQLDRFLDARDTRLSGQRR
jgi:hypothetical protein